MSHLNKTDIMPGDAKKRTDNDSETESESDIEKSEQSDQDVIEKLHDLHLNIGSDAESELKKVLVLLDFNGTLVYRSKVPMKNADYHVNRTNYTIRPFARELICHLLNDPRCEVAVYTSIMEKNMYPVLREFDNHYLTMSKNGKFDPVRVGSSVISSHTSLVSQDLLLFDQEYNIKDSQGKKQWDTKRDLTKIWNDQRIKKAGFGPSNTIMIDAELRKVRDWMNNSVLIDEFGEDQVKGGGDTKLRDLLSYLDNVVFSQMQQEKTIPEILKKNPFLANE